MFVVLSCVDCPWVTGVEIAYAHLVHDDEETLILKGSMIVFSVRASDSELRGPGSNPTGLHCVQEQTR